MDDKQLDNLLKNKLEAFNDTAPVNKGAMMAMMEGLKAVQNPVPWYVSAKSVLIPAMVSVAAGAAIFILVWTNYQNKIKSLEEEIISIKNEQIDDSLKNNTSDQIAYKPIQNIDSSIQEHIQEQSFAIEKEQNIHSHFGKREKVLVDSQLIQGGYANSIEWKDPGAEWRIAGVHFPKVDSKETLVKSKGLFVREDIILNKQFSDSRFRIGVNVQTGANHPDIGKVNFSFSPGLVADFRLHKKIRLGSGISFEKRKYSIHNLKRFRHKLHHFPRLPQPIENKVSAIKTTASVVKVPINLTYLAGNSQNRIRPLVSLGVVGSMVFDQKFDYRKPDGDYYPTEKGNKSPSFRMATIHGEAGTEVKLNNKLAGRVSVFVDRPIDTQGIEKRKFSTVGFSGTLFLESI